MERCGSCYSAPCRCDAIALDQHLKQITTVLEYALIELRKMNAKLSDIEEGMARDGN